MGQQGAGFSLDAARETVCVCVFVCKYAETRFSSMSGLSAVSQIVRLQSGSVL